MLNRRLSLLFCGAALGALLWGCGPSPPGDAEQGIGAFEEAIGGDAGRMARAAPSLRALPVDQVARGWLYVVELDAGFHGLTLPRVVSKGRLAQHRLDLSVAKAGLLAEAGVGSGAVVHEYRSLSSVALWLDEASLWRMLGQAGVARVHAAGEVEVQTSSSLPFMGVSASGDENADGSAGSGTMVAVIDSAVRYWEPEFGSCGSEGNPQLGLPGCHIVQISNHTNCAQVTQFAPQWECATNGGEYDTVANNIDHGTVVAGIARNVAPGAGIWSLNVAHYAQVRNNPSIKEQRIFDTHILAALDEINGNPQGVVSVNLSLGRSLGEGQINYCSGVLNSAFRNLWEQQGIVVAVASGNEGFKNALSEPACNPYVISVGAHYDTQNVGGQVDFGNCTETVAEGAVTCFSNSQAGLDVVAPGAFVTGGGMVDSGTSMAAPHVAAYVSILQAASLGGASARRLDAHEVVGRVRGGGINLAETAQGQDNNTYNWVHRRLSATGGIDADGHFDFHTDPAGLQIAGGGEQVLTLDTADFVGREGSQNGRETTEVWLDVEIAHPSASGLTLTLTAPDGSSHVMSGFSGANLNSVLGVQSEAGLEDAFDGVGVQGEWSLRVGNTGGQSATLYRALLHVGSQPGVSQPSSFREFSFDEASVAADGVEVQTLRLVLNDAASVDDVRVMVNHAWHTENGRNYDGYFQITPSDCLELGAGLGNEDVVLATGQCERNTAQDGSTEYVFKFVAEPSFGAADNNHVSVIWYEGGVARTGWRKVTEAGLGFDVTAAPGGQPSSFREFSFDEASVTADGVEVQTLRLVLNNAANVSEVRLMVNHAWHTENGRNYDGYLQITPTDCQEFGAGLGNEDITLLTGQCERNTAQDGSTEFVLKFTVSSSFGAADNNHVSIFWTEGETLISSWLKVTQAGLGFDVTEGNGPQPSSFREFSFDEASVVADGAEVQTLRLVLNDAANVSEVRLMVNHAWHTENGRNYDGYLQITPTDCQEFGAGLGNEDITLLTGLCERNTAQDGSTEYVMSFVVASSFGVADNNHVSIFWYEGDTLISSWLKVTQASQGFDVTEGNGPQPSSFREFSFDEASVAADGVEVQTLRLVLNDAANVSEIRLMVNHAWHTENGRNYDGYLQITPTDCQEFGAGLGNEDITLLTGLCERNTAQDGSTEFVLKFTVASSFGAADNNHVSIFWTEGETLISSWLKVTQASQGFDVTGVP